MTPIVVDLPAPFGPNKAKKSPFSTSKSIPFNACNPPAYSFLRFEMERAFMDYLLRKAMLSSRPLMVKGNILSSTRLLVSSTEELYSQCSLGTGLSQTSLS